MFLTDADRLTFLALLAETVKRFHWLVHVYTLMTTHFHIVIETPEPTLSRGMTSLNQSYVQKFNCCMAAPNWSLDLGVPLLDVMVLRSEGVAPSSGSPIQELRTATPYAGSNPPSRCPSMT